MNAAGRILDKPPLPMRPALTVTMRGSFRTGNQTMAMCRKGAAVSRSILMHRHREKSAKAG